MRHPAQQSDRATVEIGIMAGFDTIATLAASSAFAAETRAAPGAEISHMIWRKTVIGSTIAGSTSRPASAFVVACARVGRPPR